MKNQKSYWPELVRAALLGTDRATLPEGLVRELVQAGIVEEDEAAWLLHALSWSWLRRRAGFALMPWEAPLPEAATGTTARPLSAGGRQLLARLLQPRWRKGLPEFLWLLQQRRRRIPEELWPDLLDLCVETPRLWRALAPVAGRTGRWLALQHLPWLKAITDAPDSLRAIDKDEWLELLRLRKKGDPAFAKSWMRAFEQHPAWQAALIRLLQRDLHPEDEPLASHALERATPAARFPAAACCALLPDHPFGKEIAEALARAFAIQRNRLTLTDEGLASLVPWHARLGVSIENLLALPALTDENEQAPPLDDLSDAHLLLWHLFAVAPPRLVAKHLQLSEYKLVEGLARAGDLAEAMRSGLTIAAARHGHRSLCDLLWRYWLERDTPSPLWYRTLPPLIEVTPSERFAEHLHQALRRQPILDAPTPVSLLLAKADKAWSDELATEVWRRLLSQRPAHEPFAARWLPEFALAVLEQSAWRSSLPTLQRLASRYADEVPRPVTRIFELRSSMPLKLLE